MYSLVANNAREKRPQHCATAADVPFGKSAHLGQAILG